MDLHERESAGAGAGEGYEEKKKTTLMDLYIWNASLFEQRPMPESPTRRREAKSKKKTTIISWPTQVGEGEGAGGVGLKKVK